MKRTILMSSLAAALLAVLIASAQTPATDSTAGGGCPASHTDRAIRARPGTDRRPETTASRCAGVSRPGQGHGEQSGRQERGENDGSAAVPSFQTMDVKKQGYLTVADASGHEWLAKFCPCNSSHDGRLTPKEYEACLK
jgi:hypothetical protein